MTAILTAPSQVSIASPTRSWLVNISFAPIDDQTSRLEVSEIGSDVPFGEYVMHLSRQEPSDPWDEHLFHEGHVVRLRTNCDRFAFLLALVKAQFPGWSYEGTSPVDATENEF